MSANAAHIDQKGDRLSPWQAGRPRALVVSTPLGWIVSAGALCFAVNTFFSRFLFWDSYLDLTAGRFVAQHGIPRHEALTAAAHRNWIDQQWLAHWVYYEAWKLGGYPLVAGVSSLLVSAGFALLCALLVARNVPAQRAFFWTLVAFVVCFGNTVIRAQSFAYPLFVLLLWLILADARRSGRRFLLVIPLLVLWSNLHGTVLLAITLVVGYSAARLFLAVRNRTLHLAPVYITAAVSAAAALFANPYGLSIVDYYRALIGNPIVGQYIVEWAPPRLGSIVSLGFFALLFAVIAIAAYGVGRGYRLTPTLVVIVVSLALLASRGVRYQAWFAIAAVVLAAETLAFVRPAPPEFSALIRRVGFLAVLAFAVIAAGVLSSTRDSTFETFAPHQAMSTAASFIASNPGATILADEQSSSALLWLYPQTAGHVVFDARLEQYSTDRLRSWFTYISGNPPGWPGLADSSDVLVASREDSPNLVARLEKRSGWRILAADDQGIALVRAKSR